MQLTGAMLWAENEGRDPRGPVSSLLNVSRVRCAWTQLSSGIDQRLLGTYALHAHAAMSTPSGRRSLQRFVGSQLGNAVPTQQLEECLGWTTGG